MIESALEIERILKKRSCNSTDDFIKYVIFELKSPIEDYDLAIKLLKNNYIKSKDVRVAILGAYLSSIWQNNKKNWFLSRLRDHLIKTDSKTKAIIYYLLAYDIYVRCDGEYPEIYSDYLKKSICYSEHFVNNYIMLSETVNRNEAEKLLEKAISNVQTVRSDTEIKDIPYEWFLEYNNYINEFILGVDVSIYIFDEIFNKRNSMKNE